MNKKGFLNIIVIAIAVVLLGSGLYFSSKNKSIEKINNKNQTTSTKELNSIIGVSDKDWLENFFSKDGIDNFGIESIEKCEFQNKAAYYVTPGCCDRYTILYNQNLDEICGFGGIVGGGFGSCSDFSKSTANCVVIWEKPIPPKTINSKSLQEKIDAVKDIFK